MATTTFSAPQAIITIEGEAVGYMKNVSVTENINRTDVQGLGSPVSVEVPMTKIQCSLSASFYFINFNTTMMKSILNRNTTVENFKNSLVMGNFPTKIIIYKKKIGDIDEANKLVTSLDESREQIVAISDFFIESQSFELSEGGLAGTNISGRYLTPVTVLT